MFKNSSGKYYQRNKENLQKNNLWNISTFFWRTEKQKETISLQMIQKSLRRSKPMASWV